MGVDFFLIMVQDFLYKNVYFLCHLYKYVFMFGCVGRCFWVVLHFCIYIAVIEGGGG